MESLPGLARLDLDGTEVACQREGNPALLVGGEAPANVMYTSGTAGVPKGVVVPQRAVSRLVLNNGYAELRASDRIAFASHPAFDASTLEVWGALLNGGCVVVIPQDTLLEPRRFAEALGHHEVSVLWLTVGLFNQYADVLGDAFGKLRYLIVGGDALDAHVVTRVLRSHPPEHFLNGYGPTEATTFALTYEVPRDASPGMEIPLGRPISNTRVYVLDARRELVPVGVVGELYVGGDGVAHGYLNRPELTAERFLPDPFVNDASARLYRTGDLGRLRSDGNVEFLGRADTQVKLRGFRVELGEVEARLSNLAGVLEVVVLAQETRAGGKRLVAYYRGDEAPEPELLREHTAAELPAYMVPSAYLRLAHFPITAQGKVDREALPTSPMMRTRFMSTSRLWARSSEPWGPSGVSCSSAPVWADAMLFRARRALLACGSAGGARAQRPTRGVLARCGLRPPDTQRTGQPFERRPRGQS